MIRRPPTSKRTDTRFPSTTLSRSVGLERREAVQGAAQRPARQPRLLARQPVALGDLGEDVDDAGHRLLLGRVAGERNAVRRLVEAGMLSGHGAPGVRHRVQRRVSLAADGRSEEHTSDIQSLMRNTYAGCCYETTKQ